MDAFALNGQEEEEDEGMGFAVIVDENGQPVIRALNGVNTPSVRDLYLMLWSVIGQVSVSSLPDESNE